MYNNTFVQYICTDDKLLMLTLLSPYIYLTRNINFVESYLDLCTSPLAPERRVRTLQ